jgi:hypothetical protein
VHSSFLILPSIKEQAMKNPLDILEYEYESIGLIPTSVYLINEKFQVEPKRIFTVTRKQINYSSMTVEVYIQELEKFIEFDSARIVTVSQWFVN